MPTRSAVGMMVAVVIPLLASAAQAQVTGPATITLGRAYAGLSAGAIIPQDIHSSISGIDNGSLDVSFKTGPAVTGFVGYHLTDQLAAEAELGYAETDADKVSGSVNGVPISASVSGHVHSFLGFGNALWRPFGSIGGTGLSPYIGGGIGFANLDAKLNAIGGTAVSESSSNTDFAANAIVGLDYALSDRLSVGARYRFLWVNSGSTSTSAGDTTKSDDFTAHIITVNGTFRF